MCSLHGKPSRTRFPPGTTPPPKKNIIAFVERVTKEGGPDFVPVADRIATFDNDGTLWVEYPMYTQIDFAIDRVKQLAPQHPEWKTTQPFKGILEGDMKAAMATGEKGLDQVHHCHPHRHDQRTISRRSSPTGLPGPQHTRFNHPYTEVIYQPMIELLAYLRANGFKTFIVSGGEHRIHAPLDRKGLRHPARAGRRQHHEDTV